MLNGLDLFSGIGGLTIALSEWVKPIAYCEIDSYCQAVLLRHVFSGDIPEAPIWDNVETLSSKELPFSIDIIYGGFPCQDISIAGLGKGLAGKRSGLFLEIIRLAKEIKPTFIFLENVPAITSRGGLQIVSEVAEMGYDCRWCVISAASIGAKHERQRWFLLAHANIESRIRLSSGKKKKQSVFRKCSESKEWHEWPKNESPLLGMYHGISTRLDRTRALGNAVVPQQAKEAFKILMGIKNGTESK